LTTEQNLKYQLQHRLNDGSVKGGPTNASSSRHAARDAGMQYAALPYRVGEGLEILLITSRGTGRWVLPKGWPMRGRTAHSAAAREALEEAGVKGDVGRIAIGRYSYGKRLKNGAVLACTVEVYPLAVDRQLKRWPEQGQRSFSWFSPTEAAELVDEVELAALIQSFAEAMAA
jgi:8-oxo-dGTP pyrophosphatase MutT (NUDIX family)